MGTLFNTDFLKNRQDLIDIVDVAPGDTTGGITAGDTYMTDYIGKFLKNIHAAIGNLSLNTAKALVSVSTAATTASSADVTCTAAFSGVVAGDILSITDTAHADYGNHIIGSVVSVDKVSLKDALTETKSNVTLVVRSGAYNVTDAVNELDTRTYRVQNFSVTGTSSSPQTVAYSALTDYGRSTAVPTTLTKPLIFAQSRSDRGIVVYDITATNFKIFASDAGPAGAVTCNLLITDHV